MLKNIHERLTGLQILCSSTLALSMILASGAALADRPEWAGSHNSDDENNHKNKKHDNENNNRQGNDERENRHEVQRHSERNNSRRDSEVVQEGHYFDDKRRSEVHAYYEEHRHSRHCPPGLVKKHNGCMPPGHAKHWNKGEYLPHDVVYHSVEPAIQIRLGTPPAGHKFVRVASDILLIAVGTGLVVDAIDDIGR